MYLKDFFAYSSGAVGIVGFIISLINLYYSNIKPYKQSANISMRYINVGTRSYENNDEIIICVINTGMKEFYLSDVIINDYKGNFFLPEMELNGEQYKLYSEVKPGAAVLINLRYICYNDGHAEKYISRKISETIRQIKERKYKKTTIDFDAEVSIETTQGGKFYFSGTVSKKISELNYLGKPASEEIKNSDDMKS
ncbi:MAG: hypothetical protein ABF876_05385 [Acetobacter aceti]